VEIDLDRRIVRKGGEEVRLTPKEWGFLAELAKAPGRVITHGQLLRAVWGSAHEGDVEYLRVTARGLRVKLEEEPARPVLIQNEPGIGYRLRAEGLR
jgi:two-component system KDP operon response regulator KdpE